MKQEIDDFNQKEKDLEKSYKTKYLNESWKYGTDSKLIGKCYRDVYLEYIVTHGYPESGIFDPELLKEFE